MTLLSIESLSLDIAGRTILKDIDLGLDKGEVLGVVGESGSGKSMTALSVMRLLPWKARLGGRILFDGRDLVAANETDMQKLRGDDIGMVFQEPMTALNPVKTIGEQVAEGIRWHRGVGRAEAEARARAILDRVGLPEAKFPLSRFPHELSGGQRQRVVIAIACALKPRLLIADEPTTALDVVVQAQILDLLKDLVTENGMGLILISHDLAVVADMADRIAVMRHGEVVEAGKALDVLARPHHAYTARLAEASAHVPARRALSFPGARASANELPPTPDPSPQGGGGKGAVLPSPLRGGVGGGGERRLESVPVLDVRAVSRDYPGKRIGLFSRGPATRAVDEVSFSIPAGKSVALVGRSGCGKSTLARMILALDGVTAGDILIDGESIAGRHGEDLRKARRAMGIVFQDPYGSFDPRHRVERLVAEPLHLLDETISADEKRERAAAALHEVGLTRDDLDKYPHEFSGGQRQRLSIARALITRPDLIVADEPVSALDVSIRAQILDLFADLNARLGLAYLFITHDLHVARAISDDVLVMSHGKIVERGRTADVLAQPRSEAGRELVAAAPELERSLRRRAGR